MTKTQSLDDVRYVREGERGWGEQRTEVAWVGITRLAALLAQSPTYIKRSSKSDYNI